MELEIMLISLFIAIALFFVLREVFTWYWKINKLVQGQEKTNQLLQQLINYHLYGKLENPQQEELRKRDDERKQGGWKPPEVKWE